MYINIAPDLDPNYVQRFQHIAIIAQLADAILSVAQATGKCIVPLDDLGTSPEDCSCDICSKEGRKNTKNLGTPATMPRKGEENEAGKESAHLANGESTTGRQELNELANSNKSPAVENNTSLEEAILGGSGCGVGSQCRLQTNFTTPLQSMELQ